MQEDENQVKIKDNKANKRRMRLLMVVFLCFISWACVTLFHQADHLRTKKHNLQVMQGKLEVAQKTNQDMKQQIARLNDKEYIEQKVREEYHYTKPGDIMFMPGTSGN